MLDLFLIALSMAWLLISVVVFIKEEIAFKKRVKMLSSLISTSVGREKLAKALIKRNE